MRCSNCGYFNSQRRNLSTCKTQSCSNRLDSCESCVIGPYCSSCQNKIPELIRRQKHAQDSELELIVENDKLENKLELVKKKLTNWTKLIKHD